MTPYHKREITTLLIEALESMPVVILTGMRQAGKSTILQQEPTLAKRRYISLDDYASLEAAERDPESLLSGDQPITIDEAQRMPQLLQLVKRIVDKKRKPGQFLLSGSANFLLLKQMTESLAGRAVYLTLYPMSRREITRTTTEKPALVEFLDSGKWPRKEIEPVKEGEVLQGGMPSVCLGEVENPSIWFKGYEQTYLERDVRAISQVADLISFRNLLHLTALRTGQVLNQSDLGRDAKLNSTTVRRYLSLFEVSFLTFTMPPYIPSRSARLIKSPKIYFADSGIAAYLSGIDRSDNLFWSIYETYIIQNLVAICAARLPRAQLHFWNIQGRHEVDVVMEFQRQVVAIEIKGGSRWKERALSGLRAFIDRANRCDAGILAYNGSEIVSLGNRIWAVPVSLLIS